MIILLRLTSYNRGCGWNRKSYLYTGLSYQHYDSTFLCRWCHAPMLRLVPPCPFCCRRILPHHYSSHPRTKSSLAGISRNQSHPAHFRLSFIAAHPQTLRRPYFLVESEKKPTTSWSSSRMRLPPKLQRYVRWDYANIDADANGVHHTDRASLSTVYL